MNLSQTTFNMRTALGSLGALVLALAAGGCDVYHGPDDPAAPAPVGSAAPTVTFVTPENGATNVATNGRILVTFSEVMDSRSVVAAGTLTLTGPGSDPVGGTVTYNEASRTATFSPTADLPINATFTATVSVAAMSVGGRALASPFVWSFSSGERADHSAPSVVFTAPADEETDVAINRDIVAVFHESMDPDSIVSANIIVSGPSGEIAGIVAFATGANAAVFSLTPNLDFAAGATYTVTIKGPGGVMDLAGNAMAADYTWTFTAGDAADTAAPWVSFTTPGGGEANVAVNKKVVAIFNEQMNPLTIINTNFFVLDGVNPVSGTVAYDVPSRSATFTPTPGFSASVTYTATVKGVTGVRDLAGNAMIANHVWAFSTGGIPDTTAPQVVLTIPDDGDANVALNKRVDVLFSESMDSASINTANFTVADGPMPITGIVSYDLPNNIAMFKPVGNFAADTTYTATVKGLIGVKDLAGNSMVTDYVWSFSTGSFPGTDVVPPRISSTVPMDGALDVPLNQVVSATFTEPMDQLTIDTLTFTLMQGLMPVTGLVNYDLVNNIASLTPVNPLTYETTYTAWISGATDLFGNPLTDGVAANPWTFTTGDAPIVPLAINLRGIESFGLASRGGMTSTGAVVINGDVALYPTGTCTDATGTPANCAVNSKPASAIGLTVNGTIYFAADPFDNGGTANSVSNDLQIAWNEGMAKVDDFIPGSIAGEELAGKTLTPGVYHEANLGLAAGGIVIFDAQGDANAIFIVKVDSTFVDSGTLGNPTVVQLDNGAQARNIWFVVGLDITIGSGTTWNGSILAGNTATVNMGSTVNGRVLAGAAGGGALSLVGDAPPSLTVVNVPGQ